MLVHCLLSLLLCISLTISVSYFIYNKMKKFYKHMLVLTKYNWIMHSTYLTQTAM